MPIYPLLGQRLQRSSLLRIRKRGRRSRGIPLHPICIQGQGLGFLVDFFMRHILFTYAALI